MNTEEAASSLQRVGKDDMRERANARLFGFARTGDIQDGYPVFLKKCAQSLRRLMGLGGCGQMKQRLSDFSGEPGGLGGAAA